MSVFDLARLCFHTYLYTHIKFSLYITYVYIQAREEHYISAKRFIEIFYKNSKNGGIKVVRYRNVVSSSSKDHKKIYIEKIFLG